MHYVHLSAVFLLLSIVYSKPINFIDCRGTPPWEVDYNVSYIANASALFQEWLYAWQHNSWRCEKFGVDPFFAQYGLGNGFLRSAITFQRSIFSGRIYRPQAGWNWVSNAQNCTYNITSIDCYSREISSCGINKDNLLNVEPMDKDDRTTTLGKMMSSPERVDICTVAQTLKMPMAWVLGQYLLYVMRLRDDVKTFIYERTRHIFEGIDRSTQSTLTIHYRAGKPDAWRRVLSLDLYMKAVHLKASELAATGRPLAVVYLASQDNERSFKSESYLKETYGGNWTYKFLPPLTRDLNTANEIEYEIRDNPHLSREPLVMEFLSDLHLMVNADCFIGSVSTIYMVTMMLRYGINPHRDKLLTCFVNQDQTLVCENDIEKKYKLFERLDYWWTADLTKTLWTEETHLNAFRGGVPF